MRINLRKVKLLLQKTFFLYILIILLGLNNYIGVTFAAQIPANQLYFDSTSSFSLSIENPTVPVLWSRQIPASTPIPEPESVSTPLPNIPTFNPTPTQTPNPSPSPNINPEAKSLLSILNENQEILNNISWGTLVPNKEYTTTLILDNKATYPVNMTMRTENWQPIAAESFITTSLYQNLTKVDSQEFLIQPVAAESFNTTSLYQNLTKVDSQGILIQPSEIVELKLLLKISPLIEGINEFEMDFIFTATNTETDDQPVEITIASNPSSLSTFNPTPTLTPSPSPSTVLNQSNIILFSILDENEEELNEILWGTLVPGGEYNRTLILNNEGTDSLNVTMKAENWLPLKAESFISASLYHNLSQVDSQGVLIGSSEKIELKLFLKINPLIIEIDDFKTDFVFIATPLENVEIDDSSVVIKIVSNS